MSNVVIKVEGIGKRYRLGQLDALRPVRAALKNTFSAPYRWLNHRDGHKGTEKPDHIWALEDINLDVSQGDIVGVIGANGAGKSTLLKVLARITEPTTGKAVVTGRIGALLEIGTGFHQELTGRENIYLSGAIHGMRTDEIRRKFDEIVDFASVEDFIDTPVKRYSSGMQVRLGFSVAAHLETEILIVDEVLAVGDAAFQRKCLSRIGSAAGEGRTVLFVSHNMNAVTKLCTRGVLLSQGRIAALGTVDDVVEQYLSNVLGASIEPSVNLGERTDRQGEGPVRFVDAWIENGGGKRVSIVKSGEAITFVLEHECLNGALPPDNIVCWARVKSSFGQVVCFLASNWSGFELRLQGTKGSWTCTVDPLPLTPGRYTLDLECRGFKRPLDHIENAMTFDVVEGDFFGAEEIPPAGGVGVFWMQQKWGGAP